MAKKISFPEGVQFAIEKNTSATIRDLAIKKIGRQGSRAKYHRIRQVDHMVIRPKCYAYGGKINLASVVVKPIDLLLPEEKCVVCFPKK